MTELVANCKRCGSTKITFDLTKENFIFVRHHSQRWYEAFCICRHCGRATIFVLSQKLDGRQELKNYVDENGIVGLPSSVNDFMSIEGTVSMKDDSSTLPLEHLPPEIDAAFKEAATCLAVSCYNASATMFRLCIDMSTRSLLPEVETPGLTSKIRRNLGLRLPWLFEAKLLPDALQELSSCIKEDGNDGAHAGSLKKEDAEDLLDFTSTLLERMYTEPRRLELARERRITRRRGEQ